MSPPIRLRHQVEMEKPRWELSLRCDFGRATLPECHELFDPMAAAIVAKLADGSHLRIPL